MSQTACDHGACTHAAWWTPCNCSCGNEHEGHGSETRKSYDAARQAYADRAAAEGGTINMLARQGGIVTEADEEW